MFYDPNAIANAVTFSSTYRLFAMPVVVVGDCVTDAVVNAPVPGVVAPIFIPFNVPAVASRVEKDPVAGTLFPMFILLIDPTVPLSIVTIPEPLAIKVIGLS
jgi:hypothetical protein